MNPPNKAFKVYQASAGSGKTYTIVKEYLELCLKNEGAVNNYSHILAITFTNMAANEMKAKILNHLSDIINSDLAEEPKAMEKTLLEDLQIERNTLKSNAKHLFQSIIHDYSSFCVSTIDAFFQQLAKSFAKELGLPTQFNTSIDEDEVADAISERIEEQIGPSNPFLNEILKDFYGSIFDNEMNQSVSQNIHDFIKKLFKEDAFLRNEQSHFKSETDYKTSFDFLNVRIKSHEEAIEASADGYVKAMDSFMQKNGFTEDSFYRKGSNACLKLLKSFRAKTYDVLEDNQIQLLNGEYHWYKQDTQRKLGASFDNINKDFNDTVLPCLKKYQDHIGAYQFYRTIQHHLSLYVLRSIIKAEMNAYIGEEQVVPISEFNKRINDILGDFSVPFIYERIGEHFRHLFIDEFQDTSVLQWQNIVPLLDNGLSTQNMSMIVGDGKQSIYRWRSGEVGQIASLPLIYKKPDNSEAFDVFESTLINNFQFKRLDTNYRSFKNVVEFNNIFFQYCAERYLPESYRKVYLDNDPRFNKSVSIKQEVHSKNEGLVQFETFDGSGKKEAMLERIKVLVEELLGQGFKKKDIAVLVRANKEGSAVANYLNDQGIAITSAESLLLSSSDKVQLIINTLSYLIHTDNRVIVAAVLYYWNLTHGHIQNGIVDHVFETAKSIADGNETLEQHIGLEPDTLKNLLNKSYSLYDICSALIRLYQFNTLGDSYLNFLLDVVFKWQTTDEVGIGAFLEFWEKKEKTLSIIPGSTDAVNILTVHKSKGLEYPVVIYPFVIDDLTSKKNNSIWIAPEALGFEKIPNLEKIQFEITGQSRKWSAKAQEVFDVDLNKTILDNLNLHYVAFTRAEQRLYVFTAARKEDKGYSSIMSFLKKDTLIPVVTEEMHKVYQYGDPSTGKVVKKENLDGQPLPFFNESKAGDWYDKIKIDPDPTMFWISPENKMQPREWGDFVHLILSTIKLPEDIDKTLKPYLDAGTFNADVLNHLKSLVEEMARHPLIGEAFSKHAKVKNECELLSKDYGILRPDRYAEMTDKIILLDYKTGKEEDEHHEQLMQYASVLKRIVNKKIDAYLVYLGEGIKVVPVIAKQLTLNF